MRSKLDFEDGDIVQIAAHSKNYAGRIGRIIGIQLIDGTEDLILYTVMFSDSESWRFDGSKLRAVRTTKPHKHGKPKQFETRKEKSK